MVPLNSDKISRVPSYSRIKTLFTHTGLSPSMVYLSRYFWLLSFSYWPGPRSLAATSRVSVDILSSGYWDVSVHQVCFLHLCIQCKILHKKWVAPFGNPRIKGCWRLPVAYRSLLRPSSPLNAKASIICSLTLDFLSVQKKNSHFFAHLMKLITLYFIYYQYFGWNIFTIYKNNLLTKK